MQVASCLTNVLLDGQNLGGLSFLAEILSPSLSCNNDVANNYARRIYSIMDNWIGGRQM